MARISLCMIVKDEEAMLPACLASVRGAVDDMVVVDTGSKDATRRLAVEGGARVYDFAWCDDFAAARNVSLRHAHGDWVLVLDADERLAPGGAAALRASIKRARFDVGMLPLHNAIHLGAKAEDIVSGTAREGEPCFVPRLLRNTDGLEYVGRIHENVGPWLRRRGVRVQGIEAALVHFGSTKEIVGARDKVERNSKLLLERIERDPTDFEAYGYLAGEYFRAEQYDQAYDVAARGWPHFAQCPDFVPAHRLGAVRAQLQVRKGEYEGARATLHDARTRGQNPDFPFLDAYTYESEALKATDPSRHSELLSRARAGYRECLDLAHISFINVFTNGCTTWYGQTRLGIVELQLGNLEAAREAFENALTYRSENEAARLGLAEVALDAGDAAGALARLEPLLGKTPDAWILASAAAARLGRLGDARLFAKHAVKLLPAGLVGPHRRGRFLVLVEKLNAASKVAATNAGAASGALPVPP